MTDKVEITGIDEAVKAISAINKRKRDFESDIATLVSSATRKFEAETGVMVTAVQIQMLVQTSPTGKKASLVASAKILYNVPGLEL